MQVKKVIITGINEIHSGDHICNLMPNGLWHHEIVTMTIASRDFYEAIGFMNNPVPSLLLTRRDAQFYRSQEFKQWRGYIVSNIR